ncbi:actin-interacting protein [Cryomyces antarcticus]
MTLGGEDGAIRNSSGSGSGSGSGRPSRPRPSNQQQLSAIEKSVTHLLVATKQLLETLTMWSRGTATDGDVSDVYVRLGYEFNIACRAFASIGVDTQDLGPVPDILRGVLEETLSQQASQASLDNFLPRIRDIIINLLHGLKKKQQRLRQNDGRQSAATNAASTRAPSAASTQDSSTTQLQETAASRISSSSRSHGQRFGSTETNGTNGPDLPPRTTSVTTGRSSPSRTDIRHDTMIPSSNINRNTSSSRETLHSSDSSMSSNTMQNMPVITPYPQYDTMPSHNPSSSANGYSHSQPPPPPPPPPKQQNALEALQRGGELERRASRRFSAYHIGKQIGVSSNGMPMIPPSQHSPIPNRGRDAREARESMNAVRIRGSLLHGRQRSATRRGPDSSPSGGHVISQKISEEDTEGSPTLVLKAPQEIEREDSPTIKTPEDKVGQYFPSIDSGTAFKFEPSATANGPAEDRLAPEDTGAAEQSSLRRQKSATPSTRTPRKHAYPTPPQSQEFAPESPPQPGKELTLFLQYKSKIKKFVLADGDDLSIASLQLAFIEKFAWNTHSNGIDLPEIYLQDPVSGVRHELEDMSDIKDRSVLVLNIEALDEVKRHIDDGLGGLRQVVEGIKSAVESQQFAIQRVSERQQETAKEIASIAASPPTVSTSASQLVKSSSAEAFTLDLPKGAASQLSEVQNLRRDLAVIRQTYTSFVSDVESSMTTIRTKASAVKATAQNTVSTPIDGDSGRRHVNDGKKALAEESESIVAQVDDLQDLVEELRKDVVVRGVRPLPRQLESVNKDISVAATEIKKLQEKLKRERPTWEKVWRQELQVVCDDKEMLTMQEDLAADLEDDLEKAAQTFALVEQATKQQNLQSTNGAEVGARPLPRNLTPISLDPSVDPQKAKDGVLGEVRALQPNHSNRLEAIERAEKLRQKELEERKGGAFQKELGTFVEEGKLKKSGGVEEAERLRKAKDERIRREVWERQQARAAKAEADAQAAKEPAAAAAAATSTSTSTSTPTSAANPLEAAQPSADPAETAETPAPEPVASAMPAVPEHAAPIEQLEAPAEAEPLATTDHDGSTSPEPGPEEFVEAKETPTPELTPIAGV